MKKIALLCLAAFGALSLTGCDFIKDALSSKDKKMTYAEFLDQFRNSTQAMGYSKAIETDTTVTPEVKYEYTKLNNEEHDWRRYIDAEVDGITYELYVDKKFEAYYFAMDLKATCEEMEKDIDETFVFTSVNKGETFKINVAEDQKQSYEEYEVIFSQYGMMQSYHTVVNFSGIDTIMKEHYVYSYR